MTTIITNDDSTPNIIWMLQLQQQPQSNPQHQRQHPTTEETTTTITQDHHYQQQQQQPRPTRSGASSSSFMWKPPTITTTATTISASLTLQLACLTGLVLVGKRVRKKYGGKTRIRHNERERGKTEWNEMKEWMNEGTNERPYKHKDIQTNEWYSSSHFQLLIFEFRYIEFRHL